MDSRRAGRQFDAQPQVFRFRRFPVTLGLFAQDRHDIHSRAVRQGAAVADRHEFRKLLRQVLHDDDLGERAAPERVPVLGRKAVSQLC